MSLRSQRVLATYLAGGDVRRPEAEHRETVKITLPPLPGVTASNQPPVRIYVGTESAQFRAERAFLWSVQRVRDPARCYEIHLMKDFAGFERRLWLTGFTNYRFVIPELAGGEGRAIYNDTDQIYLKDPAILFDTPMGEHGVLSIHDHDTSVMLIDCAKMLPLWNWESAQNTRNRELEERMRAVPSLWGSLDGIWNARDAEYVPGESAVVHYTTIHTQPWRPFPQDYVYQSNPATDIWLSIEQEADAEHYQLFDAAHPSPAYRQDPLPETTHAKHYFDADYRRLIADAKAESLGVSGFNARELGNLGWAQSVPAEAIQAIDLSDEKISPQGAAVAIAAGLEQCPDLDVPWLLDALFERAGRAVLVSIDLATGKLPYCPADPLWWYAQMVSASARHSGKHWRLVVRQRRFPGRTQMHRWSGGALLQHSPLTWALLHYKTGHASQALGVADALGWSYQTHAINRSPVKYLISALSTRFLPGTTKLPSGIEPPWPDLIIASGWLPSLIARWVARKNRGNTRLILMGRRGGPVGEAQHLAMHCQHFGLPPHPQHIETLLPPNKVNNTRIQEAAKRWPQLYADAPRPHVALLAGGDNAQCSFNPETARKLGALARDLTDQAGGKLAVLPSRRTSEQSTMALRSAVGEGAIFEPLRSSASQDENPYLGYLATADILIVTGETESMLAEAIATGKPVYIYPLPASPPSIRQRLANWVYRQATTDRFNKRGSRRPQEGVQYLCARLVENRILLPRRDMSALHQALIEQGVARYLDAPLETWTPVSWHETQEIARHIRSLLRPSTDSGEARHKDPGKHAANA